jgi:hypothetical protein
MEEGGYARGGVRDSERRDVRGRGVGGKVRDEEVVGR